MKKIALALAVLSVALVPTASMAQDSYGPFRVGQLNAQTCAMAIVAPNGAFLLTIDTSADMTVAATRPGTLTTNGKTVEASLSFDDTEVSLIGTGIQNEESGGVQIELGNGEPVAEMIAQSDVISVGLEGKEVASVRVDADFLRAATAMVDCASKL